MSIPKNLRTLKTNFEKADGLGTNFEKADGLGIRLLKYKESSMNSRFDYWKYNKMYEKAQLRSDFRKNISLAGARTHKSDYFRAAQYLVWVDFKVNRF